MEKQKNFIEEQINKRAKNRLKNVINNTFKLIEKDPILKELFIKSDGKEIHLNGNHQPLNKNSNLEEIRNHLLEEYIKEEGEELFDKIGVLEQYMNEFRA